MLIYQIWWMLRRVSMWSYQQTPCKKKQRKNLPWMLAMIWKMSWRVSAVKTSWPIRLLSNRVYMPFAVIVTHLGKRCNEPGKIDRTVHGFVRVDHRAMNIFYCSPKCRVKVIGKKRNVVINGILEAYLKAFPNKRPEAKLTEGHDQSKMAPGRHQVRWRKILLHPIRRIL